MSAQVFRHDDPASLSAAVASAALLAVAILSGRPLRLAAGQGPGLRRAARPLPARFRPGRGGAGRLGGRVRRTRLAWPDRRHRRLLDALAPDERRVLLAHERAHARSHHYLFTALTYLAAAANPLLRPVAAAVTYTVERWADETAARDCGDRRLAARAIGKAALASAARATPGPAPGRSDGHCRALSPPPLLRGMTRLRAVYRLPACPGFRA